MLSHKIADPTEIKGPIQISDAAQNCQRERPPLPFEPPAQIDSPAHGGHQKLRPSCRRGQQWPGNCSVECCAEPRLLRRSTCPCASECGQGVGSGGVPVGRLGLAPLHENLWVLDDGFGKDKVRRCVTACQVGGEFGQERSGLKVLRHHPSPIQ
jgi:hypothetical protein